MNLRIEGACETVPGVTQGDRHDLAFMASWPLASLAFATGADLSTGALATFSRVHVAIPGVVCASHARVHLPSRRLCWRGRGTGLPIWS
jgi:hypothetical protein